VVKKHLSDFENMKRHLNLLKCKKGHKKVNERIKRKNILVLSFSNSHLRELFVAIGSLGTKILGENSEIGFSG